MIVHQTLIINVTSVYSVVFIIASYFALRCTVQGREKDWPRNSLPVQTKEQHRISRSQPKRVSITTSQRQRSS